EDRAIYGSPHTSFNSYYVRRYASHPVQYRTGEQPTITEVGGVVDLHTDAEPAGLRGAEQRTLTGRPSGAEDDVGLLAAERSRLGGAPIRVAVGLAVVGRLVGTDHADRRSGIPCAVLETDPVTSISVALRPVDASHHAGLAHHAGQRAGEKRGLVR